MLRNVAPKSDSRTVTKARRLRADMSLPEVLLWRLLRKRPGGLKFRRQHPSGPFVLDFYCVDARLAIEIDGEAHSRGDRPRRDRARDDWLSDAGIQTLRIPAAEVLKDVDVVIRFVTAETIARLPLHHPASRDGPPPRGKLGED